MRKKFRIIAAVLMLVMISVTTAAGADQPTDRYAARYVDGDIHFNLKSQEKAACVLNMRPMENIDETGTFNFDLSGGEKGEYFSLEFTENKSESTFFRKITDVQIEYNLEPVIGETELNVSVSAGLMARVYDRGLSLYGDDGKDKGDGGEKGLYLLDREKMTGQAASLSLRIVRPAPGAFAAAVICILVAAAAIVCVCRGIVKKRNSPAV